MKELDLYGETGSSFSVAQSIDILTTQKHLSVKKYNVMFVSLFTRMKELDLHEQTGSSFSVASSIDILTVQKHPSIKKYNATTIIQKIIFYKLFISTGVLKIFVPIYENQSNQVGCLLYWFISHSNRINELDLHGQTAFLSE